MGNQHVRTGASAAKIGARVIGLLIRVPLYGLRLALRLLRRLRPGLVRLLALLLNLLPRRR